MLRKIFYLLWWVSPPGLAFHGSGLTWLTEVAGDGECSLALFHVIRNFLANEIYHFSRLSHQTGSIFTCATLSIELATYSATSACSGGLFCKKFWSQVFEIFRSFFSECTFHWLQHFFSIVLVICLSWYLHLKPSCKFLTLVLFNIWR